MAERGNYEPARLARLKLYKMQSTGFISAGEYHFYPRPESCVQSVKSNIEVKEIADTTGEANAEIKTQEK